MALITRALTDQEIERLYEIDFYMFVKHLLKIYGNSIKVIDTLQALCNAFDCGITHTTSIARGIYQGNSIIIPEKLELVVLGHKQKWSYRRVRHNYKIGFSTQIKLLHQYKEAGEFTYAPKLDEQDFILVKRFIINLRELQDWRSTVCV